MVNKIKREITLPSLPIGVLEVLLFCGTFLTCGAIALDSTLSSMILPMLVFAGVMMLSMTLSGVYQAEIARSIIRLHQRTAIGYTVAAVLMVILATLNSSQYFDLKFIAIAFLFSFIVVSTIRPVISDDVTSNEDDRRSSSN